MNKKLDGFLFYLDTSIDGKIRAVLHHQASSNWVETPNTTRDSRLVNQLRSDPVSVTECHTRRKHKRPSCVTSDGKEIQRKLVVTDYPGSSPLEVMVLH